MVWEGTRGQNMRPNRHSHYILKSSVNTVLFVNANIGFSENLFLVKTKFDMLDGHQVYFYKVCISTENRCLL